jgi:hypothetical protein
MTKNEKHDITPPPRPPFVTNNRPMETYNYNLTDYPRIFNAVYWGKIVIREKEKDKYFHERIQNRNTFVETFSIQKGLYSDRVPSWIAKQSSLPPPYDSLMDHQEVFQDAKGLFYSAIHPYGRPVAEVQTDLAAQHGYYPFLPMYNRGAYTFVKVLASKAKADAIPEDIIDILEAQNFKPKTSSPIKPRRLPT